jgi:hypothetical protein
VWSRPRAGWAEGNQFGVGVIANPLSGRDIRRLVASASVFPQRREGQQGGPADGRRRQA